MQVVPKIKLVVNIQNKRKEIAEKCYDDLKKKIKSKTTFKRPCCISWKIYKRTNMDISWAKPETLAKYNIQFVNGK